MDETGEMVYSRDLLVNSDNELWIGTESGVYIYNLRTDKYVHLYSSKDDPYSLSDNAVTPILRSIIRKMGIIICMVSGYVSSARTIKGYYGLVLRMAV